MFVKEIYFKEIFVKEICFKEISQSYKYKVYALRILSKNLNIKEPISLLLDFVLK